MTSRPMPDLETWLAEHPDLDPGDLAAPWRLAEGANPLDAAPAPDPARIQALRTVLLQSTANGAPQPSRRAALRRVPFAALRPWMAAAACLVLLVAAGLFFWNTPVTVHAPYGETARVALPDGSQIQLNSGSTLTYARRFTDAATRRVQLQGEAFFDVAKTGGPFVIETFNARIAVLGTSFNVRAWPNDGNAGTLVAVQTGLVEVAAKGHPHEALRLEPGEAARVAATFDAPTPEANLDPAAATAWREDRFVFVNQPLGVMFDEIERRFGIEIKAPEKIRQYPHNIGTKVTSAEKLVSDLCGSVTAFKLRYRAMANGFEVFEQ